MSTVARQKKEKKKQPTQVWLKKLLLASSLAACERLKSAQETKATPWVARLNQCNTSGAWRSIQTSLKKEEQKLTQ